MTEQRLTTLTTLKVVGIVTGLVVVTGIWCWGWPYWCPICPNCRACPDCADCAACAACEECALVATCCEEAAESSVSSPSIVIDDPLAAVWMAMDDGWLKNYNVGDPGHWVCKSSSPTDPKRFGDCHPANNPNSKGYEDTELRPGVLFQTGHVLKHPSGTPEFLDSVEIISTSGSTTVLEDTFDWLDINTVDTKCPIDPLHAYALFANSLVTTECDGAVAIDQTTPPSCSEGNPCSGTTKHTGCLRERSLHSRMRADTDVITYWPDPESLYTVDVNRKVYVLQNPVPGEPAEIKLTETIMHLAEPVTVDRWNDGCWQQRYNDVVEVRLIFTEHGGAQHGGFHEPAMNGTRVQPTRL